MQQEPAQMQQELAQMQQELAQMNSKLTLLSSDIISTLPQAILEIILCLLPTKDAARTSILSREWRYKWTKVSKLDFHLPLVSKNMQRKCKLFKDLHQVLLLHEGPIHEFTLYTDLWEAAKWKYVDLFGLDQIIHHLSENHIVKKLKLSGRDLFSTYHIPISVYSLHHLTDLYLAFVELDHQPPFNGFSSLRSLVLHQVKISIDTFLHLLSKCPSLKSLRLLTTDEDMDNGHCAIFDLFKCLPMIEQLTTSSYVSEWLVLEVPNELPTSLLHLKYLCFSDVCFIDGFGLAFLLVLIKCSPNLEKIYLEIDWDHECDQECSVVWEEYSDVSLEHLNELEIECLTNSKLEIDFLKFILARSPKLKKLSIRRSIVSMEEKLEILQVLLRAPHASPVEIYACGLLQRTSD